MHEPDGDVDAVVVGTETYEVSMLAARLGGDFSLSFPSAVPHAVTGPGGTLRLGWDGPVLAQEVTEPNGAAGTASSVRRSVDELALLAGETVTLGAETASFAMRYDADLVMDSVSIMSGMAVSDVTIDRSALPTTDPEPLRATATCDASVAELRGSAFGELTRSEVSVAGQLLFSERICSGAGGEPLGRDGLGRVLRREERFRDSPSSPEVRRLHVYTYDAAGRLRSHDLRDGTCTLPGTRLFVSSWSFDAAGTRSDLTTNEDDQVTTGGRTYDGVGRLSAIGTSTYDYDLLGQLRTVTTAAGTTSFDHDPLGRIVAIRPAAGAALPEPHCVYDGALEPIAWSRTIAGVTDTAFFVYALRGHVPDLMHVVSGATGTVTTYRLATDERGSVRRVIRVSDGVTVESIEYDAWGNPTFNGDRHLQPFAFAGSIWLGARTDGGAGLLHMGARDYDPQIGRWTAKDPIGLRGGVNLYGYCENDPVNYVDVDGLWASDESYVFRNEARLPTRLTHWEPPLGFELAERLLAENEGDVTAANDAAIYLRRQFDDRAYPCTPGEEARNADHYLFARDMAAGRLHWAPVPGLWATFPVALVWDLFGLRPGSDSPPTGDLIELQFMGTIEGTNEFFFGPQGR